MSDIFSEVSLGIQLAGGAFRLARRIGYLLFSRFVPSFRFWLPAIKSTVIHLNARASEPLGLEKPHGVPWCHELDLSIYDTTAMLEAMCALHRMGAPQLKVSMSRAMQEMLGHVVSFGSSTPLATIIKGQIGLAESLTSSDRCVAQKKLTLGPQLEEIAVTNVTSGSFDSRILKEDYAVLIRLDCSKDRLFRLESTTGITLLFGGYGLTTLYVAHLLRQKSFCREFLRRDKLLYRTWKLSPQKERTFAGGLQVYQVHYNDNKEPYRCLHLKAYQILAQNGTFCCSSQVPTD